MISECMFSPDVPDLPQADAEMCRAKATCSGCHMCSKHCLCQFTEDAPDNQIELVREESPGNFIDADELESQMMADLAFLWDAGIKVPEDDQISLPARFNVEGPPRDNLTTSELMEKVLQDVQQMSPEEKTRVRQAFDQQLQK